MVLPDERQPVERVDESSHLPPPRQGSGACAIPSQRCGGSSDIDVPPRYNQASTNSTVEPIVVITRHANPRQFSTSRAGVGQPRTHS